MLLLKFMKPCSLSSLLLFPLDLLPYSISLFLFLLKFLLLKPIAFSSLLFDSPLLSSKALGFLFVSQLLLPKSLGILKLLVDGDLSQSLGLIFLLLESFLFLAVSKKFLSPLILSIFLVLSLLEELRLKSSLLKSYLLQS